MRLIPILVGIIAFQILFFQEKLGLNTLVFSGATVFLLWFYHFKNKNEHKEHHNKPIRKEIIISAAFLFALSAAIVVHNSLFSKIMWWAMLFTAIGLAQMSSIRLAFNGFSYGFMAFLVSPVTAFRESANIEMGSMTALNKRLRWLRYTGIAAFVFPVFFGLYYAANADFAYLVDRSFCTLSDILAAFSFEISFERFGCILLAFGLFTAIIFPFYTTIIDETKRTDVLSRIFAPVRFALRDAKKYHRQISYNPTSLLSEYRMGVVLLAMLNALLLFVNILDIRSVWFGIGAETIAKTGAELKADVHSSTYVLILSIVLATAVVGYFFRNNLNFYTKNQKIMLLSKVWLFQNMFLAITLFIHNMHYISALGFAYKRLGILAFIILVLFGVYSVFLKIKMQRTMYYLFRVNSWAVLVVLSVCALFDWDNIITNYNFTYIHKTEAIDFDFLISGMNSNKNIPTLWRFRDKMTAGQKDDFAYWLKEYRRQNSAQTYGFWSKNGNDSNMNAFYKTNLAEIQAFCNAAAKEHNGNK